MKNTIFRFKEFDVDQAGCTMKINTDGVLIGAMADHPSPMHILDIGTGTGVIALMLAQRFTEATVDAVEIDSLALQGARENFQQSRFAHRLHAIAGSFDTIEQDYMYDLIVSNPPFYTNSLHNPDERKKKARHTDIAFFQNMLIFVDKKLKSGGTLQLILPPALASEVVTLAIDQGLFLTDTISIRSFVHTDTIRQIIRLKKDDTQVATNRDFVIYADKGIYSDAYRQVLQPFFLAF